MTDGEPGHAFDEMHGLAGYGGGAETVRPPYRAVHRWLEGASPELLETRRRQAELFFRRIGITFAVYGDPDQQERLIPFDIVPRVIAAEEWARLEAGLVQRARVLNEFLADVHGAQECLRAGIVPAELVLHNPQFRLEQMGYRPPGDIWVQVAGIDVVRTDDEQWTVLEDNCRVPSGVSYMLENREVMLRLAPELLGGGMGGPVRPVETYPDLLLDTLRASAPQQLDRAPVIALLTPGIWNSAYYEHSFLADKLGVELVEGSDLFVDGEALWMRTTEGPRQIDVLYRRVDDLFLDPLVYRPDSVLGVPGLMRAVHSGRLTLANAVGTGVADDKALYTYLPELVRFYTGQQPLLASVETWRCREPGALAHVLAHLDELVVKEVDGSGGYGMLVGPRATAAEREAFAARLRAEPERFIAQPTLALSTAPTLTEAGLAPRHVDLRPFVLSSPQGVEVVPGGLTRVALREGSLIVNSSQGGGVKDSWVLDAPAMRQSQGPGGQQQAMD